MGQASSNANAVAAYPPHPRAKPLADSRGCSMEMDQSAALTQPLDQVVFAVIDVETTGLNPDLGHRLCELAIVRGRLVEEPQTLAQYVNPERPVDPGAYAVHRIPDEVLWRAPRFPEIAAVVREWLEDAVLVGHNVHFDVGFLAAEWRRLRWPPPSCPIIDTLALLKRWRWLPRYSLGHIAHALGIPMSDAHSARGDALTTWRVLQTMVRELQRRGITTLGELIRAQGGPISWPLTRWEGLPAPLQEALRHRRRLWLRYLDNQGRATERWVEPLDVSQGYLIAYCHLRGAQRTFRLDRILEMHLGEGAP